MKRNKQTNTKKYDHHDVVVDDDDDEKRTHISTSAVHNFHRDARQFVTCAVEIYQMCVRASVFVCPNISMNTHTNRTQRINTSNVCVCRLDNILSVSVCMCARAQSICRKSMAHVFHSTELAIIVCLVIQ